MALMNIGLKQLCSTTYGWVAAAASASGLAEARQVLVRSVHSTAQQEEGDDSQQRPLSQDPAVRAARQQQPAQRAEQAQQPAQRTLLSSINDPDNWGLSAGADSASYYWLGSSLSSVSSPEYMMPPSLTSPRGGAYSSLPGKGFSTAKTQPTVQRVVSRRSSMTEPALFWRSSMADPPLPLGHKGTTSVAGSSIPDTEPEH